MSKRSTLSSIVAAALPFLLSCGGGPAETPATQASTPPAAAPSAAPLANAADGATGTASVTGKISFSGQVPAPTKVSLSADPNCEKMHAGGLEHHPIKVTDGGVANVFVYVKSGIGAGYPTPSEAVMLDQNGCTYVPLTLGMQVGQPLKIRNSDSTLHNVHPRPKENPEFNLGQPVQGMVSTKTFKNPELMIPVGCDVHPWMRSHVSVLTHPFFAVTGDDGRFEIKGLPAGQFEIEARHSRLDPVSGTITVTDGEAATLDLNLAG